MRAVLVSLALASTPALAQQVTVESSGDQSSTAAAGPTTVLVVADDDRVVTVYQVLYTSKAAVSGPGGSATAYGETTARLCETPCRLTLEPGPYSLSFGGNVMLSAHAAFTASGGSLAWAARNPRVGQVFLGTLIFGLGGIPAIVGTVAGEPPMALVGLAGVGLGLAIAIPGFGKGRQVPVRSVLEEFPGWDPGDLSEDDAFFGDTLEAHLEGRGVERRSGVDLTLPGIAVRRETRPGKPLTVGVRYGLSMSYAHYDDVVTYYTEGGALVQDGDGTGPSDVVSAALFHLTGLVAFGPGAVQPELSVGLSATVYDAATMPGVVGGAALRVRLSPTARLRLGALGAWSPFGTSKEWSGGDHRREYSGYYGAMPDIGLTLLF